MCTWKGGQKPKRTFSNSFWHHRCGAPTSLPARSRGLLLPRAAAGCGPLYRGGPLDPPSAAPAPPLGRCSAALHPLMHPAHAHIFIDPTLGFSFLLIYSNLFMHKSQNLVRLQTCASWLEFWLFTVDANSTPVSPF
jgi:hypothetical protein